MGLRVLKRLVEQRKGTIRIAAESIYHRQKALHGALTSLELRESGVGAGTMPKREFGYRKCHKTTIARLPAPFPKRFLGASLGQQDKHQFHVAPGKRRTQPEHRTTKSDGRTATLSKVGPWDHTPPETNGARLSAMVCKRGH